MQRFLSQAEAGNEAFARAWAGVTGQAVDADMADALGLDTPTGVMLNDLHEASPFADGGLRQGDVILSFDGEAVESPQEVLFHMSIVPLGEKVPVEYLRRGKVKRAKVEMMAPPETPARSPVILSDDSLFEGLKAIQINPAVITEYNLPFSAEGVLITDPGRLGARAGLRAGDILLGLNGEEVETTRDLRRHASERTRNWRIDYQRGGRRSVLRFRL